MWVGTISYSLALASWLAARSKIGRDLLAFFPDFSQKKKRKTLPLRTNWARLL